MSQSDVALIRAHIARWAATPDRDTTVFAYGPNSYRDPVLLTETVVAVLDENDRLRAELAVFGRPTTEWGIQEHPGGPVVEHSGFSDAELRARAARTPHGRVMQRPARHGDWEPADTWRPLCSGCHSRTDAGRPGPGDRTAWLCPPCYVLAAADGSEVGR